MEQEEFRLEHKGQTVIWQRGSVDSAIDKKEIEKLTQEYFKASKKKGSTFRGEVLCYYMTQKEKKIWESATDIRKKEMELEAWSRFKIAEKNNDFGEEDLVKGNYQEYIEKEENVKSLGYPTFRIDDKSVKLGEQPDTKLERIPVKNIETETNDKQILNLTKEREEKTPNIIPTLICSNPVITTIVSTNEAKTTSSLSITIPGAWKKWAKENVTLSNSLKVAGGLTALGLAYWGYKKITQKDLENGVRHLAKKS